MVHAYQTNETSRIVNIIIITYFHRQDHDEKLGVQLSLFGRELMRNIEVRSQTGSRSR